MFRTAMTQRCTSCLVGVLVILASQACSKSDEHAGGPTPLSRAPDEKDFNKDRGAPSATTPAPSPPPTAENIFATRCATCHGADGKGTGPAAAALNPKPRDYTDQAWQKSVTDDQIKKTIIEGGASVGKSPLMVPNPDLANQPAVVEGLVHIVRGFGGKSS